MASRCWSRSRAIRGRFLCAGVWIGRRPSPKVYQPDRCAHVRLRQHGNEKTVAVEPMSGELRHRRARAGRDLCSRARLLRAAGDLEQRGYRQRSDDAVRFEAVGRDRSMSQPMPFHLTFQRMLSLFRGKNGDDLAQTLAQFQERANRSELSRDESEVSARSRSLA